MVRVWYTNLPEPSAGTHLGASSPSSWKKNPSLWHVNVDDPSSWNPSSHEIVIIVPEEIGNPCPSCVVTFMLNHFLILGNVGHIPANHCVVSCKLQFYSSC